MILENKVYRDPRVRLIAVSSLMAKRLEEYFRSGVIAVIHNAVDTRRFTPQVRCEKRAESRKELAFADDEFVVLLIGNDLKNKGLGSLLRAAAQLSNLPLRLLVVGVDDPRLYGSLIEELGLGRRIQFAKPSSDVLRFYAAADLYVAPSLEDSFNLPVLEAMACGLPVIASSQAGASELVHDGETGFILRDPQDDLQLANLIRRLFEDKPFRCEIGETASRYVQANCDWDENASKTREFLHDAFKASLDSLS